MRFRGSFTVYTNAVAVFEIYGDVVGHDEAKQLELVMLEMGKKRRKGRKERKERRRAVEKREEYSASVHKGLTATSAGFQGRWL